MKKAIRIHHFSGGRSSAMSVLLNYRQGDIVIFCDTDRENESTYKFVCDFAAYTGINIVWLFYKGGWSRLIEYEKALPNVVWRKCTINLKIKLARRYLRSIGIFRYIQFVGFRADEPDRVYDYYNAWQQVKTVFPLHEAGIVGVDVADFWEKCSWKLKTPAIDGNCDGCFLKGKDNLIKIFSVYPDRAEKWIKDELCRGKGKTFIKGVTYAKLFELSSYYKYYPSDLYELRSVYSCSCNA